MIDRYMMDKMMDQILKILIMMKLILMMMINNFKIYKLLENFWKFFGKIKNNLRQIFINIF